MKLKIALLAGDGIGPEVIDQAVKVSNAVAEKFKGKPKGLIGQIALPFTNSKTVDDLLQEVEEEMTRLEEYNSKRLWCASTEELNERIATRIKDAESNE